MTDDQGYGDLSCHGNPVLKTPNIDQLYAESIRLADYHVAPTCSPTRAALLTGHWTNRTGVWHTIMGRSMLRENEVTLGQIFSDAGYATGMFGKWHLGDNYPYRARRPRLHRGDAARRRRGRADSRLLGQRLLRWLLPPQRQGRAGQGLLHRCLVRLRKTVHHSPETGRQALSGLHRHQCPARAHAFARPGERGLHGSRRSRGQLLRHDRQHRRQRRPAPRPSSTSRALQRTRSSSSPPTTARRPADKVFNAGMRGQKGSRVRRRPPSAVLSPLAGQGLDRRAAT